MRPAGGRLSRARGRPVTPGERPTRPRMRRRSERRVLSEGLRAPLDARGRRAKPRSAAPLTICAMNRRTFLQASGAVLVSSNLRSGTAFAAAPTPACARAPSVKASDGGGAHAASGGRHECRDQYLPESALARERVPLMVFLHGANRTVDAFMERFRPVADATGVMLMMPFAMVGTWDAIRYFFGPDVAAIDASLAWLFAEVPVDPKRITLSGFSDGATYALALGRANGDLFTRVAAYSPGFLISGQAGRASADRHQPRTAGSHPPLRERERDDRPHAHQGGLRGRLPPVRWPAHRPDGRGGAGDEDVRRRRVVSDASGGTRSAHR